MKKGSTGGETWKLTRSLENSTVEPSLVSSLSGEDRSGGGLKREAKRGGGRRGTEGSC